MQASTEDYRRKREHRLAVARSIWPTGKGWQAEAEERARAYFDRGMPVAAVATYQPVRESNERAEARTRGIAEGRRLARARRERFRSWLFTNYQDRAALRVDDYASPEAALCDPVVVEAVCRLIGGDWFELYLWENYGPLARRLRKSKRWAALPWQREAGR